MDAVRSRLRAGAAWLPSSSSFSNFSINLSPFNTPAHMPRGSASHSTGQSHAGASAQSSPRTIYVDEDGVETQHMSIGDTPWGFFASRYAVTLGIMAVVVNRITHICRPQGRPRPLPTARRLAIQLPTIFFLLWTGTLLGLVTLSSFEPGMAKSAGRSLARLLPKDVASLLEVQDPTQAPDAISSLLWRLFLSICAAVVSSTLLRTLEGHTTIVDDSGNAPTFNLVGFALATHLYATNSSAPLSRHVYLTIFLHLCEVLGLQICTCWVSPPISRLALTSVIGVASTIHYVIAINSGDYFPSFHNFSHAPDVAIIAVIALTVFLHIITALITSTPLSFNRLVDPRSLPVSSDDYSMALFKLGTACLNSTRLSGMDADMIDIRTSADPWLEIDGSQVRIRNANGSVAKIENTNEGGLRNEIRRMRAVTADGEKDAFFRRALWRQQGKFLAALWGNVRGLFVLGVRKFISILPFTLPRITCPAWIRNLPRRARLIWHGRNGEERRARRLAEEQRRRERQRRDAEIARARIDQLEGAGRSTAGSTEAVSPEFAPSSSSSGLRRRIPSQAPFVPQPNSWHQFLEADLKEEDEEGDDDEWQDEPDTPGPSRLTSPAPPSASAPSYWDNSGTGATLTTTQEDNSDDDEAGDDLDEADGNADISTELLALARRDFDEYDEMQDETDSSSDDNNYTRVLMAHMSQGRTGKILTRSRYAQMLGSSLDTANEIQTLASVIQERRMNGPSRLTALQGPGDEAERERERMRLCVICYVEDRTIICWPCKCLALCDGCREAMAARAPSRSSAETRGNSQDHRNGPTHMCPTCRTPVIGFSRIYMP